MPCKVIKGKRIATKKGSIFFTHIFIHIHEKVSTSTAFQDLGKVTSIFEWFSLSLINVSLLTWSSSGSSSSLELYTHWDESGESGNNCSLFQGRKGKNVYPPPSSFFSTGAKYFSTGTTDHLLALLCIADKLKNEKSGSAKMLLAKTFFLASHWEKTQVLIQKVKYHLILVPIILLGLNGASSRLD